MYKKELIDKINTFQEKVAKKIQELISSNDEVPHYRTNRLLRKNRVNIYYTSILLEIDEDRDKPVEVILPEYILYCIKHKHISYTKNYSTLLYVMKEAAYCSECRKEYLDRSKSLPRRRKIRNILKS